MSETQTHKINFVPNPVQRQFIESRAKADLFSSRMGEGKSTALGWSVFYHTRHNPGASWAIIRDTWENIQSTTMKTFFEWFPPGVMGEWISSRKTFTWAEGVAKGDVVFLGMDDPADASKLMSRELAGFAIDEPAPAVTSGGVDEMIFDIGLTRLRQGGMNWYSAKLAENNPDEAHWTYKKFVLEGREDFKIHQPIAPENETNLPASYYADMRRTFAHRPDLVRRFVDGEFGFQQVGKSVTPQWSDRIHLANGLIPVGRGDLVLMWDWGHNPTMLVCQRTPLGNLLVLDAIVGEGIGAEELIVDYAGPLLRDKYPRFRWTHYGDPAGLAGEQTSIQRTPVRAVKRALGGVFIPGPVKWEPRIEPLRALLTRTTHGKGVLLVDKHNAAAVWHALRGGWHFPVSKQGIVGGQAVKNIHSHPGDALSYGVAKLYPMAKLPPYDGAREPSREASYFGQGQSSGSFFRQGPPTLPTNGSPLKG